MVHPETAAKHPVNGPLARRNFAGELQLRGTVPIKVKTARRRKHTMLVTTHLFIPGPTNIPEAVRSAMDIRMEDMRSPEFPKFTLPLLEDVKKAFKLTNGRVFLYPSSGTGAWEAAISNTLNRGDKVLMSRFGQFSLLWVDMAQRLGLDVTVFDEEWGTGVPVE